MLVVVLIGSGFVFIHLTSCLYFCNSLSKLGSLLSFRSIRVLPKCLPKCFCQNVFPIIHPISNRLISNTFQLLGNLHKYKQQISYFKNVFKLWVQPSLVIHVCIYCLSLNYNWCSPDSQGDLCSCARRGATKRQVWHQAWIQIRHVVMTDKAPSCLRKRPSARKQLILELYNKKGNKSQSSSWEQSWHHAQRMSPLCVTFGAAWAGKSLFFLYRIYKIDLWRISKSSEAPGSLGFGLSVPLR